MVSFSKDLNCFNLNFGKWFVHEISKSNSNVAGDATFDKQDMKKIFQSFALLFMQI